VSAIGVPVVECPTGAGSCVTTVDMTVENLGTDAAGAFNVRIRFDPTQGVVVDEPVSGLAAGATTTVTVSTPPGGNCYDPNCRMTVEVDDPDEVSDTNETNNVDRRTVLG
jgi:subtilase family serine protease